MRTAEPFEPVDVLGVRRFALRLCPPDRCSFPHFSSTRYHDPCAAPVVGVRAAT